MVVLHTVFLIGAAAEVVCLNAFIPLLAAVFPLFSRRQLPCSGVIRTLGEHWTFK